MYLKVFLDVSLAAFGRKEIEIAEVGIFGCRLELEQF